jgi:phage/plasmid-like protein (TIGR03299 family)
MAHQITETDNFAYVGEKAWHGIGIEVEAGLTAQEAFEQTGLDWTTRLEPVFFQDDHGHWIDIEGNGARSPRAHIRADNNQLLGMVTTGYQPMENMDLARFADGLTTANSELRIETCGTLNGGRRAFALMRLPKVIEPVPGDENYSYILVGNGHGGYAAMSAYKTDIRVVCANTLAWSENDLATGIKFRHSGDFETKLDQARLVLDRAIVGQERWEEQVRFMANKNLSVIETRDLLFSIYDNTYGALPNASQVAPEMMEKLLQKRKNLVTQWEMNLEDERNSLPGMRGTAWAALNAVTQYHDHERGRTGPVTESDVRIQSNLFGVSARDKQTALDTVLQLA